MRSCYCSLKGISNCNNNLTNKLKLVEVSSFASWFIVWKVIENRIKIPKDIDGQKSTHAGLHVVVETLGIGQEGKQSFALYNVQVSRINATGKHNSTWNVLRRYSDFHTLNSLIQSRVREKSFFSDILCHLMRWNFVLTPLS